jgi:hypothetical protein
MWQIWGRTGLDPGFWWGNPKEKGHLEDPGIDKRIILKRLLNKKNGSGRFSSDSGQEQVADCGVCGNELLGSIICDEYLD